MATLFWFLVPCNSFDSGSRRCQYSTDFLWAPGAVCSWKAVLAHPTVIDQYWYRTGLTWQKSVSFMVTTVVTTGCLGALGSDFVTGDSARRKQLFHGLFERSAEVDLDSLGIPWGGWRNNIDDLLLLHTTLWLHKSIIHWSVFPIWSCHGSLHAV